MPKHGGVTIITANLLEMLLGIDGTGIIKDIYRNDPRSYKVVIHSDGPTALGLPAIVEGEPYATGTLISKKAHIRTRFQNDDS